jgi:hypothetical protein
MNYNIVMVAWTSFFFEDILALIPKSWAQRQQQELAHALFSSVDPKRTPDFREWIAALEKEYNLLAYQMGCWELFDLNDLPEDANLIGAKWVLKLKYKNGEYETHKARIVALGYQQLHDIDFFATFSPNASYVTIRLVMALTALPIWFSVDLDATGVFISAPLPPEEQVFLKCIPGYPLSLSYLSYPLSLSWRRQWRDATWWRGIWHPDEVVQGQRLADILESQRPDI